MKVLVFGGGGDLGEYILKQLAASNYEAITIAETDNEADQLRDFGATEVMVANEHNFTEAYKGCDAVIFAAGSSPLTGEPKNILVDHEAFTKSVEETKKQNIDRFIYLSAVRVDESTEADKTGDKQLPEEILKDQDLTYTIIRPTQTVKKPGKGTIKAAASLRNKEGEIPYEDVAAFLVEALENENTFHKRIELTAGNTPIKKAADKLH